MRLVASSVDGSLRLYDTAGKLTRKIATELGHRPYQVRFSPNGKLIAVGFSDALAVEIRDATTLAVKTKPNLVGLKGRALSRVAWSLDGNTLYAGGNSPIGLTNPVLAWANAGAGVVRKAANGSAETISGILPLPGGSLIAVSRGGDMTVAAADTKPGATLSPQRADLNVAGKLDDPTRQLRLSTDGKIVQWLPFDASADAKSKPNWFTFNADQLDLTTQSTPTGDLANWYAEADGVKVTEWDDTTAPKLNDRLITLNRFEHAESVSVRNHRVLLGTQFGLRTFDDTGVEGWKKALPGSAYRVNQSGDGRVSVAAINDGTIRWYRTSDGEELLTLFVTADGVRWIAYTPQGYYAASPGGEDLVGWHVSNGAGKLADFLGQPPARQVLSA